MINQIEFGNKKRIFFLAGGFLILALGASAIFIIIKKAPVETQVAEKIESIPVKVQKAGESRSLGQTLNFPAIVRADEEASIVAKTAGTVKSASFEVGDHVAIGQELVKIDDVSAGGGNYAAGFSATEVRQAAIAVEQAGAAYLQAKQSYLDSLASSEKELNQLDIARNQAAQGKDNLSFTTVEALKSAELAYETSKTASEQARLSLENRREIAGRSASDIRVNGDIAADGAISAAGNIISSINNILDLDDDAPVSIIYKNNLGVLKVNSLTKVGASYRAAKALFENSRGASYAGVEAKLDAAIGLAEAVKKLTDDSRLVLDNSITSVDLPQSSVAGVSLSGLQGTVSGFQSQISSILAQVNGAEQGLASIDQNNDATLESLEKSYEIAQAQEASARQNLENLKAGNKSQTDNAAFGVSSADNQYDSLAIRLNAQNAQYRTQMTVAELSYKNAQTALQSVYDIHLGVAPISGTVTKKSVSAGDTVSPGQIMAVVSETSKIVLNFYIDRETMGLIKAGQAVEIAYNGDEPVTGHITSVALSPDSVTKRFLVEVRPEKTDSEFFVLGTVMDVSVVLEKKAKSEGSIILPIAAVNIGQNGSNIMVVQDGHAKSVPAEVLRVEGEAVEVRAAFDSETLVIVGNNKLLTDGALIRY